MSKTLLCVSVTTATVDETLAVLHAPDRGFDIAELRLDYLEHIGRHDLRRLLDGRPCPVIVTNRPEREGGRWVVDLRTLHPLDRETMLASVVKTGRAVVVHEAPRTNGFGSEIAALINEHALLQLLAPVERVTGFDVVFPLAKNEHLYLPNRERIVKAVKKVLVF